MTASGAVSEAAAGAGRIAALVGTWNAGTKIVDNFDLLAEATGGVRRLRELVLELAVRGKLVPQDPKDEPAGRLLEKIARERAHSGSRGRGDKNSAGTIGEVPFVGPEGWLWTALPLISAVEDGALCDGPFGSALKTEHYVMKPGYRVIRLGNIGWGTFVGTKEAYIDRERYLSLVRHEAKANDVVIASLGDPPGRACLVPRDIGPAIVKADCFRLRVHPSLAPQYVVLALNSPTISAHYLGLQRGDTRGRITLGHLRSGPFPLPPFAEQKRIVAKVDQLMALCDELEVRQNNQREVGTRLTKSALAALTTAHRPEEFDAAWTRVLENFDSLVGPSTSVDPLRQAVLWLATHGRLSGRRTEEGTGEELLERIRQANRRRWEESELSEQTPRGTPPRNETWRSKYAPPPSADVSDGLVASLPRSWSVTSLQEIAEVIDPNPSHRYPTYANGSIPLLSTREFRGRDGWDASGSNVPLVPQNVYQDQNERCRFSSRDLVMARKGRLGLARHAPPLKAFVFSHTVFVIKAVPEIDPDFLLWYLRLDWVVEWLRLEMNNNTGVPTLGKATTERLPIALPPLGEQRRLVAKVEHLMGLCDDLENKLRRSEDRASKLVEAVVQELLA